MADRPGSGEPDDAPIPKGKKRGGKVVKAKGRRPTHRLDKLARGGQPEKFIQGMHLKEGALHRQLGIPEGKKIPEKKLKKAEHSSNPLLAKRAHTAETLKGFHKK